MDNNKILYKYRGIENFRFFLDILVNNRLYASDFKSMNDPMEGVYYAGEKISEIITKKIYDRKKKLNFCSLSKKSNIGSMWCHYANDYKGVVFGVKIKKAKKYCIRDIEYIPEIMLIDEEQEDVAINILSKKLLSWKYEQEVRVFNEKDNYIEVDICEVFIGHQMEEEDKNFIEKIIKRVKPDIEIIKMSKNDYS